MKFLRSAIIMYSELTTLGLEGYIKNACGGSVHSDSYLNALERFVSGLSDSNKITLKEKFKNQQDFGQINDLLNEVAVACVFHPKAIFKNIGPDLDENGTSIEVKTLNESCNEDKRHKTSKFCVISPILNKDELLNELSLIKKAIKEKVLYHLVRAKEQLENKSSKKGVIYIIWNYDNLLHGEDGNTHKNNIELKSEVCAIIESTVNNFSSNNRKLTIKSYYFEELQKLAISKMYQKHF